MNAQEALIEIVRLFDQMDLPEDYTKFIKLKDGFASLQQLIDKLNKVICVFEEEHGDMTNERALDIYSSDYWRIRKILIDETDNLKEN